MHDILLAREKQFFMRVYTSDRSWLETVLHRDFLECGSSGRLFGREDTIQSLLALTGDRDITIYNYRCSALEPGCWLVNYMTGMGEDWYYRTSIWVGQVAPQLRFHQASRLVIWGMPTAY